MGDVTPETIVAVALGCVVVAIILALALATIIMGHRKLRADQMQLANDAQSLHDVGAYKLAGLLTSLACMDLRSGIRKLKDTLSHIRSPKDALNMFHDMWFIQLKMRLDDSGERQKIIDIVTAAMQADKNATLQVVDVKETPLPLVKTTTTAVAAS